MKQLIGAVCLLTLSGPVLAQPPREVEPDYVISLTVGQAKAFQFDESISGIYFTHKDVVEGIPQSDRQVTIAGLAAGTTRMFVRSSDNRLLYNMTINVAPEAGHLVKIYGLNKNDDMNAGFVGMYCGEFGCERPDKDLPKPTAITVERVSRFRDGAVGTR